MGIIYSKFTVFKKMWALITPAVLLFSVTGIPPGEVSARGIPENGDAVSAGISVQEAGDVSPERALALIDSLQTESVLKWYAQAPKQAVQLDSLQFELGARFFRDTGDSTFMKVALAGRKRLYAFNFIAEMKARGWLESDEQIDSLKSTRSTFEKYHMKRQVMVSNILIGELQLLMQRPDYSGSFACFFSALSTARETGYLTGEAHVLVAIARLYSQLGRIEDARSYFKEALAVAERATDELAQHRAAEGLARLETLAGDPAEGLRMYEEMMASPNHVIKRFGGFHNYFEGIARWKLGDTEGALENLHLAAAWVRERKLAAAAFSVTLALGRVYESAGNTVEAGRCYREVLNSISPELTRPELWEAAFRLGVMAQEEGDVNAAVQLYTEAIDIIEGFREGLVLEDLRLFFLADKLDPYDRLIDLLYCLSRESGSRETIEEFALEYSERSRMRSFLSTIQGPCSSEAGIDQALYQRENEILQDINVLRIRLVQEGCTGEDREGVLHELDALKLKLNEVKLSIELADRQHVQEDRFADLTLMDEVREKVLDSRTCIIEYSVGRESSYAWIVKQGGIQMKPLPGLTHEYPPVALYLELLSQGEEPHFSVGERLFTDLIQPFVDDLDGMESVIFVPDDVLYHLPFESLPVTGSGQEGERQRYLIDEYDISYTPSIVTLLLLLEREGTRPGAGEGIIAIGDPTSGDAGGFLDWITGLFEDEGDAANEPTLLELGKEMYPRIKSSRDEVNRIVSFFPAAGRKVILGDDANEAVLKSEPLDQYRVIHFATHGLFDDNSPELSGLVLSGSPGEEDGFLLVDEIMRLELDAPMVVLSGCKTGLGRYISGEGMIGLSRAFFTAGASAVVVSLWEIGDESTADFMEEFYRGYTLGLGKCRSLSRAKRKMIGEGRQPVVWAPFIIIGDYR